VSQKKNDTDVAHHDFNARRPTDFGNFSAEKLLREHAIARRFVSPTSPN